MKITNLRVGKYDLELKVSRSILIKATDKFPNILNLTGENKELNNLSDAYEFNIYLLYLMANALNKKFTEEKAREIFEYAEDCVAINDKGEKINAVDYLCEKISSFVNEVFTQAGNSKEIEVKMY